MGGDYEIAGFLKGFFIGGYFTNESGQARLDLMLRSDDPENDFVYALTTSCGDSVTSRWVGYRGSIYFEGPVECSSSSPSQSTGSATTTTQDSDGDGIPDSSDRCASNSNQRCYKESK